jgi:uncharacterized protein (DUF1800 family)
MPQSPSAGRRLARFALDRLGFGARPESIEEVTSRSLQRWLEGQLEPSADDEMDGRLRSFPSLSASISEVIRRYEADPRSLTQALLEFRTAHVVRAVHGKNQLEEVLTDFWFNHFNVFIGDPLVRLGIVRYEMDAVRPHVLGRFRDLVGAVANSWSMMTYLDNYLSTARNINENYARELMELHTMGVDGGYTQQDVEEVSRALTGWGIDRSGAFFYRNNVHDQGAKTILGQRLPAGQGKKDGEDVLDILARHPATARFLSLKLARRFVSDDPPESLVTRCAETFTRTGGDIAEVMRTLLGSEEFWSEAFGPGKIKTPHEYVLSALRAVGAEVTSAASLVDPRGTVGLAAMGMPMYEALDPTGWSDRGADWIPNPGSHLARMNFALRLVSESIPGLSVDIRKVIGDADPGDAAAVTDAVDRRIFAGLLPAEVRDACTRVSATGALRPAFKAIGVALASPAFQVR